MHSYQKGGQKSSEERDRFLIDEEEDTTNEYVLGVAFWTFVTFMGTEAVFAVIAGSQAMLTDALAVSRRSVSILY